MSSVENKHIHRIWNKGNLDVVGRFAISDLIYHAIGEVAGIGDFKGFLRFSGVVNVFGDMAHAQVFEETIEVFAVMLF